MDTLNVSLIQANLKWEEPEANRLLLQRRIDEIQQATDIIVLPEMFTTGFSMNAANLHEEMDGPSIAWMKQMATIHNCALCGSIIINDGGRYVNRFIFASEKGSMQTYDKRHLFRMGEEHKHYHAGTLQLMFEYRGWKIAPFVCYDLRFPVWMRRTASLDYDLVLLVANWPERRSAHWKILSQARAIENQSYLVAVNRVGLDGKGVNHSGDSCVYAPTGEILWSRSMEECVETIKLSKPNLYEYRDNFPVFRDADEFALHNR